MWRSASVDLLFLDREISNQTVFGKVGVKPQLADWRDPETEFTKHVADRRFDLPVRLAQPYRYAGEKMAGPTSKDLAEDDPRLAADSEVYIDITRSKKNLVAVRHTPHAGKGLERLRRQKQGQRRAAGALKPASGCRKSQSNFELHALAHSRESTLSS